MGVEADGHSDVLTTARTYAQWMPQSNLTMGLKANHLYG